MVIYRIYSNIGFKIGLDQFCYYFFFYIKIFILFIYLVLARFLRKIEPNWSHIDFRIEWNISLWFGFGKVEPYLWKNTPNTSQHNQTTSCHICESVWTLLLSMRLEDLTGKRFIFCWSWRTRESKCLDGPSVTHSTI